MQKRIRAVSYATLKDFNPGHRYIVVYLHKLASHKIDTPFLHEPRNELAYYGHDLNILFVDCNSPNYIPEVLRLHHKQTVKLLLMSAIVEDMPLWELRTSRFNQSVLKVIPGFVGRDHDKVKKLFTDTLRQTGMVLTSLDNLHHFLGKTLFSQWTLLHEASASEAEKQDPENVFRKIHPGHEKIPLDKAIPPSRGFHQSPSPVSGQTPPGNSPSSALNKSSNSSGKDQQRIQNILRATEPGSSYSPTKTSKAPSPEKKLTNVPPKVSSPKAKQREQEPDEATKKIRELMNNLPSDIRKILPTEALRNLPKSSSGKDSTPKSSPRQESAPKPSTSKALASKSVSFKKPSSNKKLPPKSSTLTALPAASSSNEPKSLSAKEKLRVEFDKFQQTAVGVGQRFDKSSKLLSIKKPVFKKQAQKKGETRPLKLSVKKSRDSKQWKINNGAEVTSPARQSTLDLG